MPHFNFTTTEAADVIAFLRTLETASTAGPKLPAAPKFKPADVDAGEKLLITTGCTACHRVDQEVTAAVGPWGGPDLRHGGPHRSAAWLMQWLKAPESLNRHHRMPVFELTDDERRQIVAALLQRQAAPAAPGAATEQQTPAKAALPQGDAARGRLLVTSAGCTACHTASGLESSDLKSSPLRPFKTWPDAGSRIPCLDGSATTGRGTADSRAPHFTVSELQRQQLTAWLGSTTRPLPAASGHTLAQLTLQRRSCLACHDRDGAAGLSEIAATIESRRDDLRGQAQALIPPELTAVGDRLRDDVLAEAVNGGGERRLPWLLVRMPRFKHTADERDALVRFLITEDRIPDAADPMRQELFEYVNPQHPTLATPEELYSGNQLAGAGGFQCTACHKAGKWEPRNVAMGTRGSDLMLMGRRLRSRYFLRWMHNPIRVVPGIEMPQLRKPVDRGLNETLAQQLGQLWTALADPRFVPPTVISRYEQVVAVPKGGRTGDPRCFSCRGQPCWQRHLRERSQQASAMDTTHCWILTVADWCSGPPENSLDSAPKAKAGSGTLPAYRSRSLVERLPRANFGCWHPAPMCRSTLFVTSRDHRRTDLGRRKLRSNCPAAPTALCSLRDRVTSARQDDGHCR
jgi:mono/diheme cytochrome c family protein